MSHPLQRCAALLACVAALVAPTSISAGDTRSSRTVAVRSARFTVQRTDSEASLDLERAHHGTAPTLQADASPHALVTAGPDGNRDAHHPQPHAFPPGVLGILYSDLPQSAAPPGPDTLRDWLIRSALAPRAPPRVA
jgi:hypothetical protein